MHGTGSDRQCESGTSFVRGRLDPHLYAPNPILCQVWAVVGGVQTAAVLGDRVPVAAPSEARGAAEHRDGAVRCQVTPPSLVTWKVVEIAPGAYW